MRARICLSLIALALALPAAAGHVAPDGTVHLVIANVPMREGASDLDSEANFWLYKRFRERHPEIAFENLTQLQLPPGMNFAGAEMAMAMISNTAPDVFVTTSAEMGSYARQGFCAPLDAYVNEWEERDRVLGKFRDAFVYVGPDGAQHIYAVPVSISGSAVFYNRRAFREAGLDPHAGPQDWDQWWRMAQQLSDPTPQSDGLWTRYGMDLNLFGYMLIHLTPLAGGHWAYQEPNGTWRASVNSPACASAFRYMQQLAFGPWERNGQTYRGVTPAAAPSLSGGQRVGHQGSRENLAGRDWFRAGRVAMRSSSVQENFNEYSGLDPDQFGVVRFPKGPAPAGRYANSMTGLFLSLRGTIEDERVKRAAWTYLAFMAGSEALEFKTRFFVERGAAKYLNPALLERFGYGELAGTIPPDWQRMYREVFDRDVMVQPNPPRAAAIVADLDQPVKRLYVNPDMDVQAALDTAQERISRAYLYAPAPAESARNQRWALALFVALATCFLAGSVYAVGRTMATRLAAEAGRHTRKLGWGKTWVAWALMAPAVLSVLVWQYIPVLWGLVMAFQDYKILSPSKWVGLDNFIRVALNPLFHLAVKNTILFVVLNLSMGFLVPVVLALLLSEVPRGKIVFRTLYYLPALTVGVVTALLWLQFYDPGPSGLLNTLLGQLNQALAAIGGPQLPHPVAWLLNKMTAMPAVILPSIWAGMGPGCIIYLAALKAIPEEAYEAADLDGAGPLRKAWHVTVPGLAPLMLINFLGAFIGAFHSMGNILVMTGGGPDYATHTLSLEIFKNAYLLLEYGQATAIAWMMASVLIGFTVLQIRIVSRMRFTRAEAA